MPWTQQKPRVLRLILHNQLDRSEYDKFAREKTDKIKSAYKTSLKESSQAAPIANTCSPPKYVIPSKRLKPKYDSSSLEGVPDPHHNLRQQMRKRIETEHEKQKSSDFTKESIDLAKCLGKLSFKS
uniref:Uncharacterized protein n=1 Tax=Ditylenchus dipsaci TaxID=166011 RepID=A0A915EUM2_9BILA